MRIQRRFGSLNLIAVVTFLLCISFVSTALAESEKLTVRVMTRNMDAGTDFTYFFTEEFGNAVYDTIQEVLLSNIPVRAALLASEIARTNPDIIALQEVTTWEIAGESDTIVLDQLDLLMKALQGLRLQYRVVAVQPLTEIQVPEAANFVDHNVILVRADLPPGHLDVIGTETKPYNDITIQLPNSAAIVLKSGWIGADIKIRGARFKFITTHLESAIAPGAQLAQAEQLVGDLQATSLPIILAGDFNSAAPPALYPPDATDSYGHITSEASGFKDAWSVLNPGDYGFTWPLFGEDSPWGYSSGLIERIDLIFSKGPEADSIENTGLDSLDGLYASDHLGVVADFKLQNSRPDIKKK